ncbi:Rap-GAP domain-containing protein [Entamoeba marina]
MSTATLKDLIAKQKQIIIQKNQDPNFNENQLMYAQKEQVVHKLINDQMNQIYKEKITIHDQLKSRLIKYKRDSRTILNGAESELHTEKQKRLSMPNSQPETFQQLLLVEKENKTSQLEDLIKKGMTITEKQRKQLIQIHEEFFANIDLKLNEIGGVIKRRRRSQSVDYLNHNKLVRLGTKARQIKQLSDNGQILIEFIKDNDKTHQERAHLLKSLAEGKVQVQMRKSGSEDEVKPKICALKPINIITELPPLTKKCQHYWGYLPIKDQFTQPQLYDPSRIWSRYPGSKTTGTLLFPREVLPLKFKQYGEDGVLMLLRWKDGEIQEVVPKGYAFPADGKMYK